MLLGGRVEAFCEGPCFQAAVLCRGYDAKMPRDFVDTKYNIEETEVSKCLTKLPKFFSTKPLVLKTRSMSVLPKVPKCTLAQSLTFPAKPILLENFLSKFQGSSSPGFGADMLSGADMRALEYSVARASLRDSLLLIKFEVE